jgi:riboflavin kinase/FMN adenylyltransferase
VTLIWDIRNLPDEVRGGAISVGNFDGVHRGHAALLTQLRAMAKRVAGPTVAVTFDPHPAALLRPGAQPVPLTTLERRAQLLAAQGVDFTVVCQTSAELLALSARQFFSAVLCDQLGMRGIVEGPNFFFGRNREGDTHTLLRFCEEAGVLVEIATGTSTSGGLVSSTEVRRRIANGAMESANDLLTAPYRLSGTVVGGDSRGRLIGFPTANLAGIKTLIPAPGVYATQVEIAGIRYASATHIGPNPTFDAQETSKVETHILDFTGDLYGQQLHVDFLSRVRDVVRFPSSASLVEQLNRDVAAVRTAARVN